MSSITGRLLDLWLPPDGAGRALGCLATTFTFDAEFFEQQCVGRFLGLDTRPGEAASDIGFLIEREEKLAETPVSVIAERRLNPDSRSLRWDILPVGGPTGVMHAKVAVLVWEHVVRLIISSANLSEQAFRRSLELAVAFDAHADAELPQSVFEEILGAVERIIRMAPASRNAGGPRPRALEILARARDRLVSFDLPQRPARGTPRIAVVMPRTGEDALTGALRTWSGGPPRWGTVMSPYFDVTDGPSRAAVRLVEVLAKRNASVDFVVPVEHLGNHEVARLPRSLQQAMPSRITVVVRDVKQPNPAEPRRLHGKLILLESDSWITALVGSSNFSAAGLGLDGGGNVEIGIAVGAPQGTPVAKTLRSLALAGEEVGLHADYEGEDDPEEKIPPVPAGFVQVLGTRARARPIRSASLVGRRDA
jgi:phosphatidylserine/phosphatidylglycerophosphate/cardiolipin synthase-like enzyme